MYFVFIYFLKGSVKVKLPMEGQDYLPENWFWKNKQ
jgi:hypothetical protein